MEQNENKSHSEHAPGRTFKLVEIKTKTDPHQEEKIDLIKVAKTIWESRKNVLVFSIVGLILGVLIALLSPDEYQSTSKLLPEASSESQAASSILQKYGGLLGLGGASASNGAGIPLDLYPQIVQSLPFQMELMNQQLYFKQEDTTVTVYFYFKELYDPGVLSLVMKYTVQLPFTINNALFSSIPDTTSVSTGKDVINLTKEEMRVIENLRERVVIAIDPETGVLTVTTEMPDKWSSALLAKSSIELLTNYLITYKTEKEKNDLIFIEGQLQEARKRYEEAQFKRADFEDRNRGGLTAKAAIEKERLASEFNLAFNVYNSLLQRYEDAKIAVQERTPVFTTLQPVQVPLEKSKPSRIQIIAVFVFLGGFFGMLFFFGKEIFKRIRTN